MSDKRGEESLGYDDSAHTGIAPSTIGPLRITLTDGQGNERTSREESLLEETKRTVEVELPSSTPKRPRYSSFDLEQQDAVLLQAVAPPDTIKQAADNVSRRDNIFLPCTEWATQDSSSRKRAATFERRLGTIWTGVEFGDEDQLAMEPDPAKYETVRFQIGSLKCEQKRKTTSCLRVTRLRPLCNGRSTLTLCLSLLGTSLQNQLCTSWRTALLARATAKRRRRDLTRVLEAGGPQTSMRFTTSVMWSMVRSYL